MFPSIFRSETKSSPSSSAPGSPVAAMGAGARSSNHHRPVCSRCAACACGGDGRGRNLGEDEEDRDEEEEGSVGGSFDCNICLGGVREAVVSLCGHLFCWPCLHSWLAQQPTCPVCSSVLDRGKVVPLYGRGEAEEDRPHHHRDKTATPIPPRPRAQRTELPTSFSEQQRQDELDFQSWQTYFSSTDPEEDFDAFNHGWAAELDRQLPRSPSSLLRTFRVRDTGRRGRSGEDEGMSSFGRGYSSRHHHQYDHERRSSRGASRMMFTPASSSSGLYVPPPRRHVTFEAPVPYDFPAEPFSRGRGVASTATRHRPPTQPFAGYLETQEAPTLGAAPYQQRRSTLRSWSQSSLTDNE